MRTGYVPYNTVALVKGGRPYFELLEKMAHNARYSFHLQTYIFDEDNTGRKVAEVLKEAAGRGVKVYVLLDAFGSQNLSSGFIQDLKASGIRIRFFQPLLRSKNFYFGRRLHHKVIVADGTHALVGGMNISNRYNDMEVPAWLDWAISVEGRVVQQLEKLCKRKMRVRTPSHPIAEVKGTQEDCEVRVRVNDWVKRKKQVTNTYLEMLRTASSDIIIMSPYFLPGNLLRKRIKKAMARRIRIRVIQAGVSDIALSKYAERFVYGWLLKNGVEIYEYQEKVLHGKMSVCDGKWVTIGSYNFNNISAYTSIELNLDVRNDAFAKKVTDTMEQIIREDCKHITEEEYKHTGFFRRLMQRFAYYIFRSLVFLFTFYMKQEKPST